MSVGDGLDQLIRQYSGLIRAKLHGTDRSLTPADLDDLEQEVRIRLWQTLKRERVLEQPASLIRRLVLSVAVDASRRVQARGGKHAHVGLEAQEELTGSTDLVELADFQARIEQVEVVLRGFEADRARVIRLYLAGFTTDEIGRLMAYTEAKARNMLYRGLDALRVQLGLKEDSKS